MRVTRHFTRPYRSWLAHLKNHGRIRSALHIGMKWPAVCIALYALQMLLAMLSVSASALARSICYDLWVHATQSPRAICLMDERRLRALIPTSQITRPTAPSGLQRAHRPRLARHVFHAVRSYNQVGWGQVDLRVRTHSTRTACVVVGARWRRMSRQRQGQGSEHARERVCPFRAL